MKASHGGTGKRTVAGEPHLLPDSPYFARRGPIERDSGI